MASDAGPGFRTLILDTGRLIVDQEFESAVRALGLPDRHAARRLFESAPGDAGRSTTAVVALPGRPERLHLRPVRHGGLLGPLWGERSLGLGRPTLELRVTAALRASGAPVPRPILVAGWRAAPLWSALFGSLHLEDALDGVAWLTGDVTAESMRAGTAAAGRAVRRFHDAGGTHADLHVKNLMLRQRPEGPEVFVIDLDGTRAGVPPQPARRMAELMRLYRSLLKRGLFERVGLQGRAAFFGAYVGGDAALGRALLEHLPREMRRVRRHARAYRRPS